MNATTHADDSPAASDEPPPIAQLSLDLVRCALTSDQHAKDLLRTLDDTVAHLTPPASQEFLNYVHTVSCRTGNFLSIADQLSCADICVVAQDGDSHPALLPASERKLLQAEKRKLRRWLERQAASECLQRLSGAPAQRIPAPVARRTRRSSAHRRPAAG